MTTPLPSFALESAAQGWHPPFRGGAIENLAGAAMGKGHNNDGAPFDLDTCWYLKPIFKEYDFAVSHRLRRKFVVKAGVKTLKSFTLEVCAADHCCNRNGDTAIYFGSGEAADATATTRILDYYRGIPRFQEKLATMVRRFDDTTGAQKFPDKTLWILSANLSNTQQKNFGFAGLQDAFVTGATGMIEQLIARTTAYSDAIVFLESQGGEKGFDFDSHYDDTDQRELHVRCPRCATEHVFNWKVYDPEWMTRGDDFTPCPTLDVPSLDHAAWVEHHRPLLLAADRRIAGFKRGPEELIKQASGDYDERAVLRETYFECFHCGSSWLDVPPTRKALDESSFYVATRRAALEQNIGFNFPQWINQRLCPDNHTGWGSMMLGKLRSQKIANELGNYEPLKIWWQKVAARTWDADINAKSPEKIGATIYDLKEKIPGELCRISGTDIQMNGTHMIYQAWAIGDGSRPRLLHYEWVKPPAAGWSDHDAREFCKKRVRELDKEFRIEQQNSMKDCAHRPDLMREWAAEDAVFAKIRAGGRIREKWITYGLLMGDERASYKWAHAGRKGTWERFKQYEWTNVEIVKDGRRMKVPVHHRLWSNPSIKQIAERWRDGDGAPKIEVHADFLKDSTKDGFWAQLTSERLLPWKGRAGKMRWDNEGRANHAWDGFCMVIVRMDELGLLNHFGPPPEDAGD